MLAREWRVTIDTKIQLKKFLLLAALFFMDMPLKFTAAGRHTLVYGIALAVLLVLMQWLQVRYLIIANATDVYVGAIAVIFTALGIWLTLKLSKPKKETVVVEKQVYIEVPAAAPLMNSEFTRNDKVLNELGISSRELEVLQLMARGMSNQEIAKAMYISLNTVKTHSGNLFSKLDVNRRIKAVEKAREFGLIA